MKHKRRAYSMADAHVQCASVAVMFSTEGGMGIEEVAAKTRRWQKKPLQADLSRMPMKPIRLTMVSGEIPWSVVNSNAFLRVPMIAAGYTAFFQSRPRVANI